MQNRPIVIKLELRQTGDNLEGLIAGPGAEAVEFSGWLGLVAGLEALLRAHEGPGDGPDDSPGNNAPKAERALP